jgi:hypothetical protein
VLVIVLVVVVVGIMVDLPRPKGEHDDEDDNDNEDEHEHEGGSRRCGMREGFWSTKWPERLIRRQSTRMLAARWWRASPK